MDFVKITNRHMSLVAPYPPSQAEVASIWILENVGAVGWTRGHVTAKAYVAAVKFGASFVWLADKIQSKMPSLYFTFYNKLLSKSYKSKLPLHSSNRKSLRLLCAP